MCKSQAEGGQRCAAHTRARFTKATESLTAATATGDPARIEDARRTWDVAAVEYASTREGRNELRKEFGTHRRAGDPEGAANVSNIIQRGHALAAANREAADTIRDANRPEVRTARDIAQGRYTFTDDDTAVMGTPRFTCENHNKPGSCTPECADLNAAMNGGGDTGVAFDPTGTTYGPDRPYMRYDYDANKKVAVEYVVTPIDRLDDTSHATVVEALLERDTAKVSDSRR